MGLLHRIWLRSGSGSQCICLSVRANSMIRRPPSRRLSSGEGDEAAKAATVRQQLEAAAREDRLDFLTAARILFSTPAKPRKFGLDFHIWQFFVACLPPFAVYLTAQYARYEMRRMEKEREVDQMKKRQATLEEQVASQAADEAEASADPSTSSSEVGIERHPLSQLGTGQEPLVSIPEKDFLAMKARIDAMEEKVRSLESHRSVPVSTSSSVPATDQSKESEEKAKSLQVGTNVGKFSRPDPTSGMSSEDNVIQNDRRATGTSAVAVVEANVDQKTQKIDAPLKQENTEDKTLPQTTRPPWFRLWRTKSVEVSE